MLFFFVQSCGDVGGIHVSKVDEAGKSLDSGSQMLKTWLPDNILGYWATPGADNATMVISKDSIYYPDSFKSYAWFLQGDSINIRYDGFEEKYFVNLKGEDTLFLTGSEEHELYRFSR